MHRFNFRTMTGYGCTLAEWLAVLNSITFHERTPTRVIAEGELPGPKLPSDVHAVLGPDDALINSDGWLYLRESLFKRLAPTATHIVGVQ